MYLHETLRICLLALESRYPEHSVQINKQVLSSLDFCEDCWAARELIELLEQHAPLLLKKRAHLVVDAQLSAIFLIEDDEQIPALWVHCRGIIPPPTGDIRIWRKRSVVEDTISP